MKLTLVLALALCAVCAFTHPVRRVLLQATDNNLPELANGDALVAASDSKWGRGRRQGAFGAATLKTPPLIFCAASHITHYHSVDVSLPSRRASGPRESSP